MKKLVMSLVLFVILFSSTVVATMDADIRVKPEFQIGEPISFEYLIVSTEDASVTYTPYVDCPKGPKPFLYDEQNELKAGLFQLGTYEYDIVTSDFEPQTCTAYIQVKRPVSQRFEETFMIQTLSSIPFSILTCYDIACESPSNLFLKDSTLYISYVSDVPGVTSTSIITYPDGTTNDLILPASIKASRVGTYTVSVTISEPGHKRTIQEKSFSVLEEPTEIPSVSVCNSNGDCDGNENSQNCPQDCDIGEGKPVSGGRTILSQLSQRTILIAIIFLFVGLIVIVIGIAILISIFKRRPYGISKEKIRPKDPGKLYS